MIHPQTKSSVVLPSNVYNQGAFAAAQVQTPRADSNHTVKYGIETFVYSRRRAFHPQKLSVVVKQLPVRVSRILALASDAGAVFSSNSGSEGVREPEPEPSAEEPQVEATAAQEERLKKLDAGGTADATEQEELAEEGTTGPLSTVIRSKGFSWLATHHTAAIYWSHAGTHFELKNVGTWWASADVATLPGGKLPDAVAEDFDGEFGDRRQEIVFIGVNMDKEAIAAALDGEFHVHAMSMSRTEVNIVPSCEHCCRADRSWLVCLRVPPQNVFLLTKRLTNTALTSQNQDKDQVKRQYEMAMTLHYIISVYSALHNRQQCQLTVSEAAQQLEAGAFRSSRLSAPPGPHEQLFVWTRETQRRNVWP